MATNVFGGRLNAVIAKTNGSFGAIGLNAGNVTIVYELHTVIKSWKPGRSINPITTFVEGRGYEIHALVDLDLEEWFFPPITEGDSEFDNTEFG